MVLQIWMLGPLGRLPRPDLCYPLWCHLMTFHSTRHLVAGYHDHLVILGSLRGRNKCWVKKLNTEFWLRSSRASGPLIKYHLAQPPPTNEMKIKLSWCERINFHGWCHLVTLQRWCHLVTLQLQLSPMTYLKGVCQGII